MDNKSLVLIPEELKITSWDRNLLSGDSGMKVGRMLKGVKVVHLPTNIEVTCDEYRQQHVNRGEALKQMKKALKNYYNYGGKPSSNPVITADMYIRAGEAFDTLIEITRQVFKTTYITEKITELKVPVLRQIKTHRGKS